MLLAVALGVVGVALGGSLAFVLLGSATLLSFAGILALLVSAHRQLAPARRSAQRQARRSEELAALRSSPLVAFSPARPGSLKSAAPEPDAGVAA
jgi:hypothetical protein